MKSFYDSPIKIKVSPIEEAMNNAINDFNQKLNDRLVYEIKRRIDIDIDDEALDEAIRNDRERYAKAYQKGYLDAKKEYQEKMKSIADIIGYKMPIDEGLGLDKEDIKKFID